MNKFQRIQDLGLGTFPIAAFGVDLEDVDLNIDEAVKDDEEEEDEIEDENEDLASLDFEKTHTLCAAFTVVSLIILFIMEFILMAVYLIISNGERTYIGFSIKTYLGHQQNKMIAHSLCKNFPNYTNIINNTKSWCEPGIFDEDFRLDLQCPCFLPKILEKID